MTGRRLSAFEVVFILSRVPPKLRFRQPLCSAWDHFPSHFVAQRQSTNQHGFGVFALRAERLGRRKSSNPDDLLIAEDHRPESPFVPGDVVLLQKLLNLLGSF